MLKQKHQQLFDILSDHLANGKWPSGTRLPNLRDLASQYAVSVKVATQAVNLLKAQKLVTVRTGDGVYSATNGNNHIQPFKFSEARVFGTYVRAKILRILLEDTLNIQWNFWESFFRSFTIDNADIELEVHRYTPETTVANVSQYDLALGGIQFLCSNGFFGENLYTVNALRELLFTPLPQRVFLPESIPGQDVPRYLPYTAVCPMIHSNAPIPPIKPGEYAIDYVERVHREKEGQFIMRRGIGFLENSGVSFVGEDGKSFSMPDRARTMDVFSRMRHLYSQGALNWFHGYFSNFDKIWDQKSKGKLIIAEGDSNSCELFTKKLNSALIPHGNEYRITYICAAIARHCRYPEECLRVYQSLLQADNQKEILTQLRAYPAVAGISPESDKMAGHISKGYENLQNSDLITALYKIVEWELMRYMNGQRGEEVYDLIQAKIKYFFETAATL